MADPVGISLENVSKRFGKVEAVRTLSIDIKEGEFFSLLGPSGCGKTTTLRMIAGFEQPDDGGILLRGTMSPTTPPNRRNVNMVFQHYALFPHMSIFDNVAFALRLKRVPKGEQKQRVEEMLRVVGLEGLEKRKPDSSRAASSSASRSRARWSTGPPRSSWTSRSARSMSSCESRCSSS